MKLTKEELEEIINRSWLAESVSIDVVRKLLDHITALENDVDGHRED